MPRDMFGDVVDPSIKVGGQKWYTVPLSILVHTAGLIGIIVIPLLAADALPEVPSRPRRRRHRRPLRRPLRPPPRSPRR